MNTWFQFKQFTIHQDKSAMKVCTDACLFGAWVAKKLEENKINAENILDVGCGTGLLSLMLAQKSIAQIDAVEIDENAYEQAKENIELAGRNESIHIYLKSINSFDSNKKYDLIICNPPFYENQLKSDDNQRNLAMHACSLSFINLAKVIKHHLSDNGVAAILLPNSSVQKFEYVLRKQQLFSNEKQSVAHSPSHQAFRCMLLISKKETEIFQHSLNIKNSDNEYSQEFKFILKDYYLHF